MRQVTYMIPIFMSSALLVFGEPHEHLRYRYHHFSHSLAAARLKLRCEMGTLDR